MTGGTPSAGSTRGVTSAGSTRGVTSAGGSAGSRGNSTSGDGDAVPDTALTVRGLAGGAGDRNASGEVGLDEEPATHRDRDQLGSLTGAHLAGDPGEVTLHSQGGQTQLLADLTVRVARGHELKDAKLSWGQGRVARARVRIVHFFDAGNHEDQRTACHDGNHALRDHGAADPVAEQADQLALAGSTRENDDTGVAAPTEGAADGGTVACSPVRVVIGPTVTASPCRVPRTVKGHIGFSCENLNPASASVVTNGS